MSSIVQTISLETVFPEYSLEIQKLRDADPLLDEICKDFELLSADLTCSGNNAALESNDTILQIADSLKGLAEEIAVKLNARLNSKVHTDPILDFLPIDRSPLRGRQK